VNFFKKENFEVEILLKLTTQIKINQWLELGHLVIVHSQLSHIRFPMDGALG
jgi:hypothetical protein